MDGPAPQEEALPLHHPDLAPVLCRFDGFQTLVRLLVKLMFGTGDEDTNLAQQGCLLTWHSTHADLRRGRCIIVFFPGDWAP